jgi:hypothetical protein
LATLGFAGVTAIELKVGDETTVIVPDMPLAVPLPLSVP